MIGQMTSAAVIFSSIHCLYYNSEFKKAVNSAVSFVDSQSKILENSIEILAFPNVNTKTYSTIIMAKLAMIVSFPVVAGVFDG